MSSLIQVSDSNAIVYISSTLFFGQLTTIRDIAGNRSSSNIIIISTVGTTFDDGSVRKIIDTPYATLTVDSTGKVVHEFPFTYGASEDADGLTIQRSLAVTGPTYIYDSLYTYTSISTLGKLDANSIYVGQMTNSIAMPLMLVSTAQGIGQIYTSSILFPIDSLQSNGYTTRSNITFSVANLGTNYISVATLQSTIDGFGSYNYVSVGSAASTVQSLSTSYLDRSQLTSTIAGLGTFGYISKVDFLSTAESFRGGVIRDSSYQSTIAGLATANYVCTGQLVSTLNGLGTASYISTDSLISTTFRLTAFPFGGFTSLYISSTEGLGQRYISSSGIISTFNGVSSFNGSNLQSTVNGLATAGYVSMSQLTSTIQGLGQIYVSSSVLRSTVGGLFNSNYTASFVSTVANLGTTGYISTLLPITSSVIGYEGLQMRSTVAGAGTRYLSTTQLFSTVQGLSNIYVTIPQFLSTIGGETRFNTSNLVSTVTGLGSLSDPYLSTTRLFSTVSNILSINKSFLTKTTGNIGSYGYFSTPSLFSTVQRLGNIYATPSNLISSVSGINSLNGLILVSTVRGLGSTVNYMSTANLISTVNNVTALNNSFFSQTIESLGSSPYFYISLPSLVSSVRGISSIYCTNSNLISSVAVLASFNGTLLASTLNGMGNSSYISTPQLLLTVSSVNKTNDTLYSVLSPHLASPPYNYISTASLSSTIMGLKYMKNADLLLVLAQNSEEFSANILSTNRGLRFIGQPPEIGGPPVVGSSHSLFWSSEFLSSIMGILGINANLFYSKIANLDKTYVSNDAITSTVAGLVAFSYLPINNQLPQLASTLASLQQTNPIAVTQYINTVIPNLILNTDFISTVSSVTNLNTSFHINLVDTLGSPPYSYISAPSLFSTVQGLSNIYVTTPSANSTVTNLSFYNVSTLVSTVCGLGNSAYISSTQLFSTVSGIASTNLSVTVSTVDGLANVSYISTASMVSTVRDLGNLYISSSGLLANVSTYLSSQNYTNTQLTSSIVNLGTKGYYSTTSIISTVAGLGFYYVSTPQLISTNFALSNTYLTISTLTENNAAIRNVLLTSRLASTTVGLGSLGFMSSVGGTPDNYIIITKERSVLLAATAQVNTSLGTLPGIISYSNFTIPKISGTSLYIFQSNAIVPSSYVSVVGDGIITSDIYCTRKVQGQNIYAKAFFCDGTRLWNPSDIRLKFDIVPLSNTIASLRDLKGTSYRLIDNPDRRLLGFLAQDVEVSYPELVFQYSEHKSIKYDSIGVVLLEAIKELNCECDELLASLSPLYNKGV